jgi:hypothetical protein
VTRAGERARDGGGVVAPALLAVSLLAVSLPFTSCVPAAAPGVATEAMGGDSGAPRGSLRQSDITLTVQAGDAQVRVTPVDPDIIPLLAPDTGRRLSALLPAEGETAFLVSVFTVQPGGALFEPRSVVIDGQGQRFLPRSIRPLSPGWGTRIPQDQSVEALYIFPGELALDFPFTLEVAGIRNDQWGGILPLLDAERSRLRTRTR